MESNNPNVIPEENNQSVSQNEQLQDSRVPSLNKRFPAIFILLVVVVIVIFIAGLIYFKNAQNKPISTDMSNVPTQSIETKTESSTDSLENEAASIPIDDVNSNFSDIDKDLKELK